MKTAAPAITMRDFFNLPAVISEQDIQKKYPHGSPEHRAAFDAIVELAKEHGVERWFPAEY